MLITTHETSNNPKKVPWSSIPIGAGFLSNNNNVFCIKLNSGSEGYNTLKAESGGFSAIIYEPDAKVILLSKVDINYTIIRETL